MNTPVREGETIEGSRTNHAESTLSSAQVLKIIAIQIAIVDCARIQPYIRPCHYISVKSKNQYIMIVRLPLTR